MIKEKVDPSKLKELLSKDLRISEIAEHFNCCKKTIYYWKEKFQLEEVIL